MAATKEEGKEQTDAWFSVETGWMFCNLEEAHCDVELSNPLVPLSHFQKEFYAVRRVNIPPAFSQNTEQNLVRICDIHRLFENKLHSDFSLTFTSSEKRWLSVLNFNK